MPGTVDDAMGLVDRLGKDTTVAGDEGNGEEIVADIDEVTAADVDEVTTAARDTTSRTRPTRGTDDRVAEPEDETKVDGGVVIKEATTSAEVGIEREVTTTGDEAVVAGKL